MTTLEHKGVKMTMNQETGLWSATDEERAIEVRSLPLPDLRKAIDKALQKQAQQIEGWCSTGYSNSDHRLRRCRITFRPGQKTVPWVTYLEEGSRWEKSREQLRGNFYPDTETNHVLYDEVVRLEDEKLALEARIRETLEKMKVQRGVESDDSEG